MCSADKFLEEIKSRYNQGLETQKNLDNKSSSMIATSGTLTGLLFGFGTFLVTNLLPSYEFLSHAIISLIVAILCNIASVFFSILAYRIGYYMMPLRPDMFFTEKNVSKEQIENSTNYDETLINQFKNAQPNEFQDRMITDYIYCANINLKKNRTKAKQIILAQWVFLVSLMIIIILISVLLHAYSINAIRTDN